MLGSPQLARLGLSREYESGLPIAAVAFRGLDDIRGADIFYLLFFGKTVAALGVLAIMHAALGSLHVRVLLEEEL